MNTSIKRTDSQLELHVYEQAGGSSVCETREAAFTDLAEYAKAVQSRAEQCYLYTDGGKHWELHGNSAVRMKLWIGLVDEYHRSFCNDWGFLTIQTFDKEDDLWAGKTIRHYMPLDWAVREIEKAKHEAITQIANVVQEEVQRGVANAVENNIKQLEDIDRQIANLQKEREKLERAEAKRLAREQAKVSRQREQVDPSGYVYLLRTLHDATLFKIGRTANPDNRVKTFNVKLPFPVEFDCLISTPDMYALESELHSKFASKRLDGEWFRLSETDIEYIRSLTIKD